MIEDPPVITLKRHVHRPSAEQLAAFKHVPTGFIADAMNGRGAMDARIKPVIAGQETFSGVALPVHVGPADNLGVMAYGDIGGSNRNILTVDANNNFSVLTPPTAPSISIVSIELLNFQSPYQYTITFSVSTDPNLYPVTNYTFQANNQSIYPLKPEPDNPQIFKQQLLVVANHTSSFKVKATNAIGTGPYSDEVSKVISIPISVVIKSASNSTITLSVSRGASSNPSSIKYEYSPNDGRWYNATFSSYTIESGNYTIVIKTQYNLVRSIPIIVRVTPTPGVPVTSGKFTST